MFYNHLKRFTRTKLSAAVLIFSLIVTPFSMADAAAKPGFNLFSPQQDYEIGRQSAAMANRRLPIIADSRSAMVNRIGRRLAAVAPGTRFPYEFRIVNDSSINAFALPGGFVYVNRGALDAARDENEVAAVLAHEIAHVSLRHGTKQASRAYLAQAGLGLVGSLLGQRGNNTSGQILAAIGGLGLNTLFLKHSRSAESEADLIGAQMMQRAGYNPRGMISFLQTIQRHSRGKSVEFLSDHPNPANRVARLEQAFGPAPRRR